MPDYADLKELHRVILGEALKVFREKAIGDDLDQLVTDVQQEIRKEFQLLKARCMNDTKRRCEAAVQNEVNEFLFQLKQGQMRSESEIAAKLDLLRQIMLESLENITYSEKESFVQQKCSELGTQATKQLLQELRLRTQADQRLLQGQVNMLQDDLKDRKAEFEERARVTQDELNQTIAEQ